MKKATRKQVKRHNQQLVLRAIYEGLADNRASLAIETGLTKPTISNIVSELMEQGFVEEGGRGESTASGGKRPTLLNFIPNARQIIAVTVNSEQILACLAYLDNSIVARHHLAVNEGDKIIQLIHYAINALIAQQDASLLCISVGVSGVVDDELGIVQSSPVLKWENVHLAEELSQAYRVPVYIGNNTEFATRAQVAQREHLDGLVTLLISDSIEIGSTLDGQTYQHGGTLHLLTVPTQPMHVSFLEWRSIKRRMRELAAQYPHSLLNTNEVSFLLLKRGIFLKDEAALHLLGEMSRVLAQVYAWVIALLRPAEIALAGSMSYVGDYLLIALSQELEALLPLPTLHAVRLSLAQADDLSLQGAIASALAKELGL